MEIIRWRPFQEMEMLHRQMDQIFDEVFGSHRGWSTTWTQTTNWAPAIELKDTNETLILRAEIPGINAEDLEVQVAKQAVLIAGEIGYKTDADERGYYRSELRYGKFQRIINLPVPIKNEEVQAEFKNGILTLKLPKAEEAKFKVVKVNVVEEHKQISSSSSSKIVDVSAKEA